MSKHETSSLPDVSQWQAQTLRVTAFPSPSAKTIEPKWWSELLGAEPETRNIRPSRGELIEQGPFDKGILTLQVLPIRIDWILALKVDVTSDELFLPSIGPFPELGDKFIKLMAEWLRLASAPSLQRLAFGAVLHQPVEGKDEGYKLLSKYLPSIELSADSRDFHYQINRPQKSKVPEMTTHSINCLSKWASVSLTRGIIQYHAGEMTGARALEETTYACSLELDMSTPADFKGELPKQVLVQSLRELYEFGIGIASKGDIA